MESDDCKIKLRNKLSSMGRRKSRSKVNPEVVDEADEQSGDSTAAMAANGGLFFGNDQTADKKRYKNTKRGVILQIEEEDDVENGDFTEAGTGLEGCQENFKTSNNCTDDQIIIAGNRTILQYFIRLGESNDSDETMNFDFLEQLFEVGTNPNCSDIHGQTLLHEAVRSWHTDVAKFLIDHGASVNSCDNYGRTPLHVAAKLNYPAMVKLLIKHGADKEARTAGELQTAVHYAAKNDSVEALEVMLSANCKYKYVRDYRGRTPLHIAAEFNRSEAAIFLLKNNAPAGVRDSSHEPLIVWLILNMPMVAKLALNQFHKLDRTNRRQYYLLNHLESKPVEDDGPLPEGTDTAFINITTVVEIGIEVDELRTLSKSQKKSLKWRKAKINEDLQFVHPRWPEEEQFLVKQKQSLEIRSQYWKDFWNIFDWICLFLLVACQTIHAVDVSFATYVEALTRNTIRLYTVTIIFIWLRLMKDVRPFTLCGPFIVMLGKMLSDILRFMFLYGIFYVPFACAFWMQFGGDIPYSYLSTVNSNNYTVTINNNTNYTDAILRFGGPTKQINGFATVAELLFSVFRMTLVDEYPWQEIYEVDPVMATILVVTWLAISAILCINIFIAMLSDTFQRVYDNAKATALMQKMLTVHAIEQDLSAKKYREVKAEIFKSYSPESLFYDQDPSTDDQSELKHNIGQLHEQLINIKSWLAHKLGFSEKDDDSEDDTDVNTVNSIIKLSAVVKESANVRNREILGMKTDTANMKDQIETMNHSIQTFISEQQQKTEHIELMIRKLLKDRKIKEPDHRDSVAKKHLGQMSTETTEQSRSTHRRKSPESGEKVRYSRTFSLPSSLEVFRERDEQGPVAPPRYYMDKLKIFNLFNDFEDVQQSFLIFQGSPEEVESDVTTTSTLGL
ncbi:uncharacterized protein LOC141898368 [Tubulanus polymorphus]|uniref:uncharacterized protein LOC141898368 n=1 Tax=Tubulanus polymorphus TaxID=672921 RepID=UPI003DA6B698